MGKQVKRILAVLLGFALCSGLAPLGAITASATSNSDSIEYLQKP